VDQPAQGSAHRILTLHGAHNLIKDEVFVKRLAMSQEVLGCALYLLTTTAIPRTGPVWARGFCPGSRRPRARVPLVVWAWDLLLCGFSAAVSRPPPVASFSLCDLRLFVIKRIYSLATHHPIGWACGASTPCGGPRSSSCVVCGCAWRSCVRRLPAVVFSRLVCGAPLWGSFVRGCDRLAHISRG